MSNNNWKKILEDDWYKTASRSEMMTALANLEREALSLFVSRAYKHMNRDILSSHDERLDEVFDARQEELLGD